MNDRLKEMEELVLKKGNVTEEVVKIRNVKKKKFLKQEKMRNDKLEEIEDEEKKLVEEDDDGM